ncbi:unnamed protein product [Adineta steineri]|uniref:Uncharacterized protein n=1 Tax=Adineta steineri TaxID=433720 RepID=A0A814YWI7_9BILA|nr:unnamed protein product [Adineta steineri]CAF1549425.1 unnamed protein product [Adineta steineri]
MQSLHYNSGSIKLTRERATMVSRWEANEVARWVKGLAGIQSDIGDLFIEHKIDGIALSLLLREDLIKMGIIKLDQQLILMQSVDLLLTLANRLGSETLALLFMRIHCAATTCFNLLRRPETKESINDNSTVINSPEFHLSISNLSEVIVTACHWLGRLPFIENIKYIELRRKIIKVLVQIRLLLRNLRLTDEINMPKTKLIIEINELRTTAMSLIHQNKDSLFSSDCYLIRVHLRRPLKDDVNIEYTTMPDYTHVISSIETEAMSFMGSGFSAINIGDEIIEINNQVVVGWDPKHFNELVSTSSHSNEICLLVKKMPRHNDDEVYTKRLADGPQNPRRVRARGALERRNQQTEENRTMLLEQDGEIEIESDDETLYQSKRSSQIKRDQHSSLPDLTETLPNNINTYNNNNENADHTVPSSAVSSISTTTLVSPTPSTKSDSKQKDNEPSPNATPKSPRKSISMSIPSNIYFQGLESYIATIFRARQDSKSVIADTNNHSNKDHPQLVNIKRIHSIKKQSSTISLNDDQIPISPSPLPSSSVTKSSSQTSLQTSSARSSFSSLFRLSDTSDKNRRKRSNDDSGKSMTFRNEMKMEIASIFSNNSNTSSKPPLNHSDSRKSSGSIERRRLKRTSSSNKISCKDLGKGDCEGFLNRYLSKGGLTFVQWKVYWCVLKGGTLYVYKSKDDRTQEIEIKLEGKSVSPAPEKRKYGFCIADEYGENREYFYCLTRDEMAKWMNKMGLAAINFNIDDSKIAGFNKGFLNSYEGSPATTPIIGPHKPTNTKHQRTNQINSAGDSGNDSDKESTISWQKSVSHHSSISDMESSKDKNLLDNNNRHDILTVVRHERSSSASIPLPERNTSPIKTTSNHMSSQMSKGHHRTCSSPIRFPPAYEDDQESAYINAASSRLTDSDSSTEHLHQRTFVNSQILNNYQDQEHFLTANNYTSLMLNSSGGFSTPTPALSSTSSNKTPSFSPSLSRLSSQRQSNNSIFLLGDDEYSLPSSRSASYSQDRPNSLSEDPLSPVFEMNRSSPPINVPQRQSSSQYNSPAVVHTAPLPITTYSPIPFVNHSISSTNGDDDESYFVHRSPPSLNKKFEQSNNTIKFLPVSPMQQHSSNLNLQQQSTSTIMYKTYRFPTTPSEEQQKL